MLRGVQTGLSVRATGLRLGCAALRRQVIAPVGTGLAACIPHEPSMWSPRCAGDPPGAYANLFPFFQPGAGMFRLGGKGGEALNWVRPWPSPETATLFLLMTAALILPVIPERIGRLTILPKAGTALRVGVLAMMTMAAAGVALSAIRVASSIGFLGEEAQKKNETQSQSRGGILIGGRPEILVSSQAVLDSPILGHGSWAKDPKYTDMLYDIEAEYDLKPNLDEMVEAGGDLIPTIAY